MRTKKVEITESVRKVLERSTLTHFSVTLPPKLDRPTYDAVMKVLDAAGGVWDRKTKTHVFPHGVDPSVVFGDALDKGEIVHEKKTRQAFYTPPAIAEIAVARAWITAEHDVLEPSAGGGALLTEIVKYGPRNTTAVEIDDATMMLLTEKWFDQVRLVHADFLLLTPRVGNEAKKRKTDLLLHDRIVMNPPFTDGQDVQHVAHAFKFLKRGGRLVAIMPPAIQFRQDRRYEDFRQWLERNTEDRAIEALPEGAFAESGTNVKTVLLSCRYCPQ